MKRERRWHPFFTPTVSLLSFSLSLSLSLSLEIDHWLFWNLCSEGNSPLHCKVCSDLRVLQNSNTAICWRIHFDDSVLFNDKSLRCPAHLTTLPVSVHLKSAKKIERFSRRPDNETVRCAMHIVHILIVRPEILKVIREMTRSSQVVRLLYLKMRFPCCNFIEILI